MRQVKIFTEDSSQGIVGILSPCSKQKHDIKINVPTARKESLCLDYFFITDEVPDQSYFVYKISKNIDTIIKHEFKIAQDLERLNVCMPHFNRAIQFYPDIRCKISTEIKDGFNPFRDQKSDTRDMVVFEYIPSKLTLLEYIKKNKFLQNTNTLIHQLLLALFVAQQEIQFTHYDLHLDNVLVRTCSDRTFFLYKFQYHQIPHYRLILTNGVFPVIFDYGFAYSNGTKNTSYNNSLFFTDKGYTPFKFDPINDFKTLMVRLTNISKCPKNIQKFTKETFLPLGLDKETGWLKTSTNSIGRNIINKIKNILEKDRTFIYKKLDDIIDLFCILIKVPITPSEKCSLKKFSEAMNAFIEEWSKIEMWFPSSSARLNILKRIFQAIDNLISKNDDDDITHDFKLEIFKILDDYGKFVNVVGLNYSRFLSSIVTISCILESMIHFEISKVEPCDLDSWKLFVEIEDMIKHKDHFIFREDDNVVIFDCVDKITASFEIDAALSERLNQTSLETQIKILLSEGPCY